MDSRHDGSSSAPRRVTLLLDGLSRATIVSFGPRVIHRLLFGATQVSALTWAQVTYPLAITVAAYTIGRNLGTALAEQFPVQPAKVIHSVTRLGGAALALHVFSFGTGLSSVRWWITIRLLAGTLAGYLCRITRGDEGQLEPFQPDEEMGEVLQRPSKKNRCFADVTSGTAKIYITGFAVSMLTGGLLYRLVSASKQFHALTGGEPYTLSPMFFVFVAFVGEVCLRGLFWYSVDLFPSNENKSSATSWQPRRQIIMGDALPGDAFDEDSSEFQDPLSLSRHMSTPSRRRTFSGVSIGDTPSRSRLNSSVSEASEFFDCESFEIEGDMFPPEGGVNEDSMELELIPESSHRDPNEVAIHRDNKCVYEDGSPAFVPPGYSEESIPTNYINYCSGNERKALRMWEATKRWRREENVWRIHTAPHPYFSRIKESYPHFIHGHSKTGFPIVYEQPGRMNLRDLFRSGCQISEMVKHYKFLVRFWVHHENAFYKGSHVFSSSDGIRADSYLHQESPERAPRRE